MKKYLGTFEIAKMCHVSPGSVIRWIHEGKLAAVSTAGGHRRVPREEVAWFLKSLGMPVPVELENTEKIKVLIVDDEKPIRELIQTVIRKHLRGALIEEAEDGFIAGTKLNSFVPHLVILDLNLPGLNGLRVCDFIRKAPQLKKSRILAISGLHDPGIQEKILKLGANDFLAKPFDVNLLREKIAAQIDALKNGGML